MEVSGKSCRRKKKTANNYAGPTASGKRNINRLTQSRRSVFVLQKCKKITAVCGSEEATSQE